MRIGQINNNEEYDFLELLPGINKLFGENNKAVTS